jgi:hypothetical protein
MHTTRRNADLALRVVVPPGTSHAPFPREGPRRTGAGPRP